MLKIEEMRACQYSTAQGGLENNLVINEKAKCPPHDALSQRDDHIMVEVITASINRADYQTAEMPGVGTALIRKPASPGMDYCGRVASTGSTIDTLSVGELVFGRLARPTQYGTLGQYILADKEGCVSLPEGLHPDHAATIGTAGWTAYKSIVPNVRSGDRVFINGGSGGTGTFGIQIAKLLGCHVTTTCSTDNIDLCSELGADMVIDYGAFDVTKQMESFGASLPFDLVVDNVGLPADLYEHCHHFLQPEGKFISIGGDGGWDLASVASKFLPSFMGGGKRRRGSVQVLMTNKQDDLAQLGRWMAEGKIKPVIDSTYNLRDASHAFERLKSGRTKGKIVVHVQPKGKEGVAYQRRGSVQPGRSSFQGLRSSSPSKSRTSMHSSRNSISIGRESISEERETVFVDAPILLSKRNSVSTGSAGRTSMQEKRNSRLHID
ncbi:hypothetical protein MBLNU459_g0207t1 [Dothideomycetes sp. NU459]